MWRLKKRVKTMCVKRYLPVLLESKQELSPHFLFPEVLFYFRRQSRKSEYGILTFCSNKANHLKSRASQIAKDRPTDRQTKRLIESRAGD